MLIHLALALICLAPAKTTPCDVFNFMQEAISEINIFIILFPPKLSAASAIRLSWEIQAKTMGENQATSMVGTPTLPDGQPAGNHNNTASSSRISALASIIAENASKLDESLKSHGLVSPSFNPSSSDYKWPQSVDSQRARMAIFEATSELQALILEPAKLIQDLVLKVCHLSSFQQSETSKSDSL